MTNLHVAVDDMSWVAYVAQFDDERATTCAHSVLEAAELFAAHGVRIERVLTDHAKLRALEGVRGGPRRDRRPAR